MKKNIYIVFTVLFASFSLFGNMVAQQKQEVVLDLTLDQAIELAQKQSIESFKNKNMYLAKYWEFRTYRAQNLPVLGLSSTPLNYYQAGELRYNSSDNTDTYIQTQKLSSDVNLTLKQNISATGTIISANSQLLRIDNMQENKISLNTTPISIAITQPINGYNSFKWKSRIEPIKFEMAKRELVQSIEQISIQTTERFFRLASAEINLKIAETNFSNADTLFRIAKGRFEIGTVTQDELLDFELGFLNSKIDLTKSKLSLQQAKFALNSFLGLESYVGVKCIVPDVVVEQELEIDRALGMAIENNPEILGFNQQLLEANKKIAQARGQSGLGASVRGNFGIEKNGGTINDAYVAPFDDQRGLSISLNVPIVDWGARHGQILMAKSDRDVTEASMKQARIEFEQSVLQQVMEFNLQDDQVVIAAKADTIAQLGYNVTKQRFLIDKVDVIKLNAARNSLDAAKRNYIDALRRYWNYYYTVRMITLFDFTQNRNLLEDFDQIVAKP